MSDLPASSRDVSPTRSAGPVCGIFLVGFMGAGKTTVGQALAASLGWRFQDLDVLIEAREQKSVPLIFRDHGEHGFRAREHAALQSILDELHSQGQIVVALGGGAFAQSENASLLRSAPFPSVFLDAPVEELWRRCSTPDQLERPLRKNLDDFRRLHEQRRAHYLAASLHVDTSGKSVENVAREIIERIGLAPKEKSW
jgi:shikimate kinase